MALGKSLLAVGSLLAKLSGCSNVQVLGNPECVWVATIYDGEIKPIEDVGVVVLDKTIGVSRIDGETYDRKRLTAGCGVLQGSNLIQQIHLLPGVHVLSLGYASGQPSMPGGAYVTKGVISLPIAVGAGGIYNVVPKVNMVNRTVSFEVHDGGASAESVRKQFEGAKRGR
jgi:hypothetical protein